MALSYTLADKKLIAAMDEWMWECRKHYDNGNAAVEDALNMLQDTAKEWLQDHDEERS